MIWNKADLHEQLQAATTACLNASQSVSDADFFTRINDKWSIAENMIHLEKVAKRIAGALSMPREQLANFGISTRPSRDFNEIIAEYRTALQGVVVVPKAFQGIQTAEDTRASILETYTKAHAFLETKMGDFTEDELDKYQMPHPLLGLLTLREMLSFVAFHIGHHQKAVDRIVKAVA
jgi:hypothetical protein